MNKKSFLAVAALVCVSACTNLEEYPTGYGAHHGVTNSHADVSNYDGRQNAGMNENYDMDAELMNNGNLDRDFNEFQRKSMKR